MSAPDNGQGTPHPVDGHAVRVERHGPVGIVVLDRPSARNAINAVLAHQFCDAIDSLQDVGAIVVTGADPAFCAGLDLRNLGAERITDIPRCAAAVAASDVPVIAAVNGPAVTGGLELALACDFIIASERASFADTHLAVHVYPGPVLVDLPRRVGMAWARQMSLTAEFIDAATACRIGLANEIATHDDLLAVALSRARRIAGHDTRMVADMRRTWDTTDSLQLDEAHRTHLRLATELGYRDVSGSELSRSGGAVLQPRTIEKKREGSA